MKLTGTISGQQTLSGALASEEALSGGISTAPGQGTRDYNRLTNKPQINGVELVGDKSLEALGDTPLTNLEIKAMFNNIFGT